MTKADQRPIMGETFLFSRGGWQRIIVGVIVVCFLVDTGASVIFGYERMGGGWQGKAMLYALAMGGLATIATWLPWHAAELFRERRRGLSLVCTVLAAMLFVFTQSNSFAVWGVGIADGAVKRDGAAGRRVSLASEQARLEAERAALGVVRAPAAIRAEADLECSRTSARYLDGRGPKCTVLLAELAGAERAAAIEGRLPGLRRELAVAPQVAAGAHDVHVWIAVADAFRAFWADPGAVLAPVREEDARFGWVIFVSFLVGLVANFGPVLFLSGVGGGQVAPAPEPVRAHEWAEAPGMRFVGGPGGGGGGAKRLQSPGGIVREWQTGRGFDGTAGGWPLLVAGGDAGAPDVLGAPEGPGGGGDHGAESGRARSFHGSEAAAVPVDRATAEGLIDHLLVFRAACVADCAGGVVSRHALHERYAQWAGPGAVAREAFDAVFPGVAGLKLVTYGQGLYYQDVALREVAMTRVV